ncbi:MAG: DivIVA domain-containing protein [Deltaproteobacteria bacterium]|nr:DivIVA domain-containing protein [Deltaproteobacteria bacterium]MBW1954413.1 DivIVA domain-containing protein [Deltaproteobacteria bacterium]MBW2041487.1 DivIVA domain-containing protein [Deltaproteobacteria bacterium]MBW2131622.1 DivIVA domain-containing protein [Deltaproteobacteria bacterium]
MEITPDDIQEKQFRVRFRGFDIGEVDAFLEEMARVFRAVKDSNHHLKKELEALKQESLRQKEREKTFERALANSQKVLDQMRENARKSAEVIIADAEVKAERMLNRAHNRLAQLHEDIAELKRQRMQIEVQIRSVLEAHTKLLEMGREGMEQLDEEDAKLKILRHPVPPEESLPIS